MNIENVYKTKSGKYSVSYKEPTMRQRIAYTDMCANTGKRFGDSEELMKLTIVEVNGNRNNPVDFLLDLPISENNEVLEIRDYLFGKVFPTDEEKTEQEKK